MTPRPESGRNEGARLPRGGGRRRSFPGQFRSLSLRTKVFLTLLGASVAVVAVSTYLSFDYWGTEALSATRGHALLAARSARVSVESALARERPEVARRHLTALLESPSVVAARIYEPGGRILVSAHPEEEGAAGSTRWIPRTLDIPTEGVARELSSRSEVGAWVPLRGAVPAILEIEFSVAPLRQAIDRGARLGIGLMVGSVLVLSLVLVTMLEREVVEPLHRVEGLLDDANGHGSRRRGDELGEIRSSVTRLIRKEREAERIARARHLQLEAREGLAQVGEMAAEMAHEFKRPLASIRTAIDMLEQEYELQDEGRTVLEAVNSQLEHLSDTMQDLFSLAKPVGLEQEDVSVADALDNAVAELAAFPGMDRVQVERDYGEPLPPLVGDGRRLSQAFLNLMVNAVEAMPEGGTLRISAWRAEPDAVILEFEDTGSGIPEEDLERVFLPFHSTKPVGTGLGLPLVARIISAHGGRMGLESHPGEGTIARLEIPARSGEHPAKEEAWQASES